MYKLLRLFLTAIYMYGVPMMVAAVPYTLISKTNVNAGIVFAIIVYVIVFIFEVVGSSSHLEEYIKTGD